MQSIKRADHNLYDTSKPIELPDHEVLVRYFKGVGELKSRWVSIQKNYASEIIPYDEFMEAQQALQRKYPLFQYECVSYHTRAHKIKFESCWDFDTAEEPTIKSCITYDTKTKQLHYQDADICILHKWLYVKDDYLGFNVQEAYNHSKLQEVQDETK